MGTAVLRSHDPLNDRLHLQAFGFRSPPPPMRPFRRKPSRSGSSSPPTGRTHKPRPAGSPPPPTPPQNPKSAAWASPAPRPGGRRVSFVDKENSHARANGAVVVRMPARNLVMEEVKILKRGQDLTAPLAPQATTDRLTAPLAPQATTDRGSGASAAANDDDVSPLFSTERRGPEPEILPKQIGFSDARPLFAGPAFIASPSPSAVPFPASFLKRGALNDVATRGLRCLLGLNDLP